MQLRFCGTLTIGLHYAGRTPDNRPTYLGYVQLPDQGRKWTFNDLCGAVGEDGTRAPDYDEMARSAVGFAAYWTSHNRGPDTPAWAPAPDLADSFDEAAEVGEEDYIIDRLPPART